MAPGRGPGARGVGDPVEDRVSQVIERIQRHRREADTGDGVAFESRRDRALVLQEAPRLFARLSQCVAALNGRLGDEGVWLRLVAGEHDPAVEAAFIVSVDDGVDPEGPDLLFHVDFGGRLSTQLVRDGRRSLLKANTVFGADRTFLTEALLELLDARYGASSAPPPLTPT